MGLFDMLGGFATAGAQVYETGINYKSQQETNAANIAMNEANNAQNMALTTGQWARDDNSVQRRVADMRAAGLNPVLAAGQGAQSSAPISMQAGKTIAPQVGGLSGALGKGVATYADLVRAKEIKEQTELQTELLDQQLRVLRSDDWLKQMEATKQMYVISEAEARAQMAKQDAEYYRKTGLPSNAGSTETSKIMQARAAAQAWAKEHPGVLPSGLLDFLGGN